jgi:hypothetical protein
MPVDGVARCGARFRIEEISDVDVQCRGHAKQRRNRRRLQAALDQRDIAARELAHAGEPVQRQSLGRAQSAQIEAHSGGPADVKQIGSPSRIVPAGAAAGIGHRYAYNESGMADIVPPVNIWIAVIYSKGRENIGKDGRKSAVLGYFSCTRCLLPTSSSNAAFRDVDFYK